jgi:acylphosphatase
MICKHVIYEGRVQGVGFRYTTQRVASGFRVAGFVRNREDGRVELVAEGEPEQVDGFLDAVAQRMTGYIQRTEVQDETPQGFPHFGVRH